VKFYITKGTISKEHSKLKSSLLNVRIETASESYYLPILRAFYEIHGIEEHEEIKDEQDIVSSSLCELGCMIAQTIISFMPPARIFHNVKGNESDMFLIADSKKSKSLSSGNISDSGDLKESSRIQSLSGIRSKTMTRSLQNLSSFSASSISESRVSYSNLTDELAFDELELDYHSLNLILDGFLSVKQEDDAPNENVDNVLVPNSNPDPFVHQRSLSISSKNSVLLGGYDFPEAGVVKLSKEFENGSTLKLFGKLPDVLIDHGFSPLNFETCLRPDEVKLRL
jgi:hypothetical protein